MSNSGNYQENIHNAEIRSGMVKLRTLLLEFDSTLDRVPKLRQEVEKMLVPNDGVNYDDLAIRVESQLEKTATLLAKVDLLPKEILKSPDLEHFYQTLSEAITIRTVDLWCANFDERVQKAIIENNANEHMVAKQTEEAETRRTEEINISDERKTEIVLGEVELQDRLQQESQAQLQANDKKVIETVPEKLDQILADTPVEDDVSDDTIWSRFDHDKFFIVDKLNDLIWARDANLAASKVFNSNSLNKYLKFFVGTQAPSGKMTLPDSIKYIEQLNEDCYAGINTWRIPTGEELKLLIDYSWEHGRSLIAQHYRVLINAGFDNVMASTYWTMDAYKWKDDSVRATCVDFSTGLIAPERIESNHYVWPVADIAT